MNIASLDVPIGEEKDSTLKDFIENRDALTAFDIVAEKILSENLFKVLDTLTGREKEVLMLRYGFCDGVEHTLEEIGKNFNLTRERIRQIEAKALKKIRLSSYSKNLKEFWD